MLAGMTTAGRTSLVMGASGFVGSHVTRQLVARGDRVLVWVRPSSASRAFGDLDVEVTRGELTDGQALREVMRGVDELHYCIVDTRAWLRNPAPLYAANVDGLRHALDAAAAVEVPRFVFCSTIGTIALSDEGPANEDMAHNWGSLGGPYIQSRLAAEDLVLRYHRDRGLPAVILCVSTTYGPHDYGPTPHGKIVRAAAQGKMPAYVQGASMELVAIEDVARAFLLAAERGRPGERYIISDQMVSIEDILRTAAAATGASPPRIGIPLAVMRAIGRAGDAAAAITRRDMELTSLSVRLMHIMSPLDHGKATRELGWQPTPALDAVRRAAMFFTQDETKV
jgi:dihydroflavonol-4-reductase